MIMLVASTMQEKPPKSVASGVFQWKKKNPIKCYLVCFKMSSVGIRQTECPNQE